MVYNHVLLRNESAKKCIKIKGHRNSSTDKVRIEILNDNLNQLQFVSRQLREETAGLEYRDRRPILVTEDYPDLFAIELFGHFLLSCSHRQLERLRDVLIIEDKPILTLPHRFPRPKDKKALTMVLHLVKHYPKCKVYHWGACHVEYYFKKNFYGPVYERFSRPCSWWEFQQENCREYESAEFEFGEFIYGEFESDDSNSDESEDDRYELDESTDDKTELVGFSIENSDENFRLAEP